MPTLLLLRHAKSSWSESGLSDFDRPLAPRGEKAAPRMGRFIADNDLAPDAIICSSALRARQTLELALGELAEQPSVTFSDALYLASPAEMLALVRKVAPETDKVMLIGHNPGFHALSLLLSGSGDEQDLAVMAGKYPTAALAVIDFDGAWRDLGAGLGHLRLFATPRRVQAES